MMAAIKVDCDYVSSMFQDLLSFELLDINIVQEMEHVPNNTPVGKILHY